jgi:hypothetical protein
MFAQPQPSRGGFGRILLLLLLLVVVAGIGALTLVDPKPETQTIEQVIPNDRFN